MPRPSAVNSGGNAGFTLMEVMVAVAISGFVALLITEVYASMSAMQKRVRQEAELESARALLRVGVDCEKSCAGLTPGVKTHGTLTVETSCDLMYNDAKVTFRDAKDPAFAGALFTLDPWVCKPRRPKRCVYACHNTNTLLERGYFFPSLDKNYADAQFEPDLHCPLGRVVGVDFSTRRIICEPEAFADQGPYCTEEAEIFVGPRDAFNVAITGKRACTQHTRTLARFARLEGRIKITIAEDFKPDTFDVFPIIVAHHREGTFAGTEDGFVETDRGRFRILYKAGRVLLTGFVPRHPSGNRAAQSLDTPVKSDP